MNLNLADWTGLITLGLLVVFWITLVLLIVHLNHINKENNRDDTH